MIVDIGTNMQIQKKGKTERFQSTLIGMKPGKFLIIEVPISITAQTDFQEGNILIVRYIHEGNVFGFNSQLLNTMSSNEIVNVSMPSRLFFIKYPKKIANCSIRQTKRVYCSLPSTIVTKTGQKYKGSISDISSKGCLIMAKGNIQVLTPDTDISIYLLFPGINDKFIIAGTIKNVNKIDDDKLKIGVRFLEINPEVQKQLNNYLSIIDL